MTPTSKLFTGLALALVLGLGAGTDQAFAGPGNSGQNGSNGNGPTDNGHNTNGVIASSAGGLNAAKASPNARLHANEQSRVGLIATFEENRNVLIAARDAETDPTAKQALQDLLDDMNAQIAELSGAANKTVDASVVDAVKSWLGLSE